MGCPYFWKHHMNCNNGCTQSGVFKHCNLYINIIRCSIYIQEISIQNGQVFPNKYVHSPNLTKPLKTYPSQKESSPPTIHFFRSKLLNFGSKYVFSRSAYHQTGPWVSIPTWRFPRRSAATKGSAKLLQICAMDLLADNLTRFDPLSQTSPTWNNKNGWGFIYTWGFPSLMGYQGFFLSIAQDDSSCFTHFNGMCTYIYHINWWRISEPSTVSLMSLNHRTSDDALVFSFPCLCHM